MMKIAICLVLVIAVLVEGEKICAVSRRDFDKNLKTEIISDVKFEACNDYCYALWQEDVSINGTSVNIFFQGCWKQEGHECEHTECKASSRIAKPKNHAKFCCCKESYCNVNVTITSENRLLLTGSSAKERTNKVNSENLTMLIATTIIGVLLVTLMIIMLLTRIYKNNLRLRLDKPLPFSDNFNESTSLRTGTYTVDHLKLQTILAQGRFGSVWQGSMGDQDVAVKIFPAQYHGYFQNEKNIYSLPFMEHPSLLHYYGCDERMSLNGNMEYLLVFSYAPGGTLREFLQYHVLDWLTFCKMSLSVVKGLAYLHTDVRQGEKVKPCLAHRDINSRNILIKADGTCCICDFGLAVPTSGSKHYVSGEEQHEKTKSINDVGSLHYMAPEILEGAVNLRDCESSLKQIDVYAVGLVLWELVSRCRDIYVPGAEVPPYKMPYEKEIGLNPTFEQMQVLVSRNKARPLLEGNLANKPGVRLIRETMEDCWDPDAEARLTALCIEERLMELQSHRITMYFTDGNPSMNSHCGLVPSTTNSLCLEIHQNDGVHVVQMTSNCNEIAVDNLVNLTPMENPSHENSFKNSNETATAVPVLQPHQGRNPCMERNLMIQSDSSEELGCNGNVLVNKSSKHQTTCNDPYSLESQMGLVPHHDLAHGQHLTQQHLQLRPATPIPFVQNLINSESTGPVYNKLKQTNIDPEFQRTRAKKHKFNGWGNLKKKILSKKMMYSYGKDQTDQSDDSKSNLLKTKVEVEKRVNEEVSPASPSWSDKSDKVENRAPVRPTSLSLSNSRTNNVSQRSLDKFNEVFNTGSTSSFLKESHNRIKTPGDLPPSVRKIRGRNNQMAARFSLYDDRMMCQIINESEDQKKRPYSNSVPYGIDFSDEILQARFDPKDVTCF